ncbi:YfhH family protein [Caldalkalibacillus mannanilyticus]|uniref:YfhH family protein n=1 Tax=Caldalkalibacillus mannanilyticus TaxID=1418 RepID=UPI000468C04C|nr:YfhH family protein [Caldalkalibacillus mannanilyticus]
MKRYSEMTQEELFREMQHLLGESRKKHQAGFISEGNILEQKFFMAKSYTLDPQFIEIGKEYTVIGEDEEVFTVLYLNGVFAWGRFPGSTEDVAFPIGRLEKKEH